MIRQDHACLRTNKQSMVCFASKVFRASNHTIVLAFCVVKLHAYPVGSFVERHIAPKPHNSNGISVNLHTRANLHICLTGGYHFRRQRLRGGGYCCTTNRSPRRFRSTGLLGRTGSGPSPCPSLGRDFSQLCNNRSQPGPFTPLLQLCNLCGTLQRGP